MISLKKKYKKVEPFMKWLRRTRNKISKETHNMTTEELNEYYDKRADKFDKKNEKFKKNNKYFSLIIRDKLIHDVYILYKNKFDTSKWIWDHQEEVYNATRGKNRNELIDYFESIYQYIQKN